jgi:tetratricopeptide (TPR) repeat protein
VAVSLIRKGEAYLALEAFQDSLEAFQQVLAMIPLEQDAATRAKVLVHVGVAYFYLENHDKALESFVTALEIQRTWLDGPVRRQPIIYDASMTLSNMGRVYLKKKEYQLSYSCFEEAFVLQSTTFPKDHDIALYSLKSMALVLAKNHQLSEALPILHNMLSLLPSTGNDFIEVMGLIGLLQAKDLEFEKSSESLQKVLAWQKSHLFMSSPDKIALTQQIIERVEALDDGKVSIWV